MPLTAMPGRCGPRTVCILKEWDFDAMMHEAQRVTQWKDGQGVDPVWMFDGLRELGATVTLRYNCNLNECVKFLKEYKTKKPFVLVDYWDDVETSEGHWAILKGLDERGNPYGINPDFPEIKHYTWPRQKFLLNWYDYTIERRELVEGVAIFGYWEPPEKRKKKQ